MTRYGMYYFLSKFTFKQPAWKISELTSSLYLKVTFFFFSLFIQLAQDEGSPVRGFGVVEYESAEQAEAVLIEMDRTLVGGQEVRLSLCTPGTSGRSTLAALIAAQGMVSIALDTNRREESSHTSHTTANSSHDARAWIFSVFSPDRGRVVAERHFFFLESFTFVTPPGINHHTPIASHPQTTKG